MRWSALVPISIIGLLSAWSILLIFPSIVLRHELQHGPFTIRSATPIDMAMLPVLDSALARLKRSEIFDPSREFEIFLCPDQRTYTLFVPMSRDAFAATYPFLQHIFMNRSDIATDRIWRPADRFAERSLSGVIAHETTHVLLEDHYGLIRYKLLPAWFNEGYCDHVARESSIDEETGRRSFCAGDLDHTYFLGRLRIEQLLHEHTSIERIDPDKIDLSELDARIKQRICP